MLLGAIGDVTRGLPLLQRLRGGYPRAHITWAVEPASAPLLEGHPALNEVLIFDRPRGAGAFVDFLRRVRAQRPDLTLDLQRHLKSGVVSWMSRAPVRLGFHRRNGREGNWLFTTHRLAPMPHFSSKLEQFLRFADWLGVAPVPISFGLHLTAAEEERVEQLLGAVHRPFVAAFVGASWESKQWFPESTAAVSEALAAQGIDTVLLGGPTDVEFAAAVAHHARAPVHNLAGQTNLRDLIGIFQRARAAFGPDSGPMHIAAAVGARVVSVWGATDPARSGPWANEAGIIRGTAPCSPCYLRHCPIGRLCMRNVPPQTVADTLLASAGGTQSHPAAPPR